MQGTFGSLNSLSHKKMAPFLRKGPCPKGIDPEVDFPDRRCFPHDPDCGCHGPIMTRGFIGWAGL